MEKLNRLGAIGPRSAEAQGGILLGAFQRQIEAQGQLYPPDPTSREECSLGASIACNASGARSFRYGPTRPWVEALEVVLPTGELLFVRRGDPIPADWPVPRWQAPPVKTAAGYETPRDLLDLFIGQEGTLGILTWAQVKTLPLPREVLCLMAYFPDRRSALSLAAEARAGAKAQPPGRLAPRALEYLDRHCLDLVRSRLEDAPAAAGAALFVEQEVDGSLDEVLEAWLEALDRHGALVDATLAATDDATRQRLHRVRHAVPAGINEAISRRGMPKVGTDLAVPLEALDEMMDLYESAPSPSYLFGHLGDCHLHLNLLPGSKEELAQARAWYDDLARRAVALGGTVSAEHGIGKLKRQHLAWMVGEDVLGQFVALKRHLDPHWILGRGNLLVPPEL
jgi:D-lactate dehydrogenase (cytochrome)